MYRSSMPISSENLVKLMASAYPGLITYIDKNFQYQYANDTYYTWFGTKASDVQGKNVKDVIGPDNFNLRKSYMERALKGEKVSFTNTFTHTDLGQRFVEQVYCPDVDQAGNVVGFIAMAYDITDQKIAENLAKENEARFRSLAEVMPQLVWVADSAGKVIWFNESWPRVTGTTYEENLGDGWLAAIHPEDRVGTLLSWKDNIAHGPATETLYRLRMANGSYRWHVSRCIEIRDEAGKIIRFVGTTTDIEDQKAARELADKEREKVYSIFQQAPLAITVTRGPEHIFELLNPAAEKYLSRREILGRTFKQALPELAEQGFFDVLDKIYHSGEGKILLSQSVMLKNKYGGLDQHYYDIFYQPIKDENGLTTAILNMNVEVTDRVLALKRAEESEELFRSFAESMPQMAFIANAKGEISYINQRWFEFFGAQHKFSSYFKEALIIHPEDQENTLCKWNKSISTGESFQIEYRLRRKDGLYRWHLCRALPLRDSRGEINQWVGTNTDIHGQKEIESYQSRLVQVLESSFDFIGMSDEKGKVLFVNDAGRKMVGLEGAELEKLNRRDFFFPEDMPFIENIITPSIQSTGQYVGEFRFRHFKTGEEVWVHYNAFATHNEKTGEFTGFGNVSRDLTEMKQKERSLEEALKARDQFLSIASHELKTNSSGPTK